MNMQAEIQAAAKRLENLLNRSPDQFQVSIDVLDMHPIERTRPQRIFCIRIISTYPVQIYPPTGPVA